MRESGGALVGEVMGEALERCGLGKMKDGGGQTRMMSATAARRGSVGRIGGKQCDTMRKLIQENPRRGIRLWTIH